ncbi:MAG TPA: CAP domain-containing protein [Thermoanaerobaculia bacterium]|nr:CAP domain-containing protein [Thermoanaerobaculia bacterium]
MIDRDGKRYTFGLAGLIWLVLAAGPFSQTSGSGEELKLSLKQDLVKRINRDRAGFGLRPVEFDPPASVTADAYCERQIREGTTGHYSLDGHAPYARYSQGGGNDGVSENAAAWSANYSFPESSIPDLISKSEEVMLQEKPPHDGHRRTILDPAATHVGIGLAWKNGEFRMTEEFLRRYVEWDDALPRSASIGERVVCRGKPVAGYKIVAASVHREDFPRPISALVANQIDMYSLPPTRRDFLPQQRNLSDRATQLARYVASRPGTPGDLVLQKDGSFSFVAPFYGGPGLYTVVLWVRTMSGGSPISASNISIRVDHPSLAAAGGTALAAR